MPAIHASLRGKATRNLRSTRDIGHLLIDSSVSYYPAFGGYWVSTQDVYRSKRTGQIQSTYFKRRYVKTYFGLTLALCSVFPSLNTKDFLRHR